MRNSLKLFSVILAILLFVYPGLSNQNKSADESIKAFDNTEKWITPYEAHADKSKKIQDGITAIKPNMTYTEAVTKLGAPDAVYDLRKAFFGLSPQEDGMLIRYRDNFSFRAIWYLSKTGESPNLNDKWFALYIGTDEKTVVTRLANKVELPKKK
jgi:hypothetical protein